MNRGVKDGLYILGSVSKAPQEQSKKQKAQDLKKEPLLLPCGHKSPFHFHKLKLLFIHMDLL